MKSRVWLALAALVLALAFPVRWGYAAQGAIPDPALLDKVRPGSMTQSQVTEILGRPAWIERPRAGESWEYWLYEGGRRVNVSVGFDDKGIVRGIEKMRPAGGP